MTHFAFVGIEVVDIASDDRIPAKRIGEVWIDTVRGSNNPLLFNEHASTFVQFVCSDG